MLLFSFFWGGRLIYFTLLVMKFHVQKKKIVRITIKYKVRIKSVQKCLLIPAGVTMTQGSSEYKPGEVVYSLRQEAALDIVKFSISVKTI